MSSIHHKKMAALMSAITYSMLDGHEFGTYDNRIHNGVSRVSNPWDRINLTKSERRGKTYEEIQSLRKQRYEETLADEPKKGE